MQVSLCRLSTFTMSDGGELVTVVLSEPCDVEVNEVLEVVDGGNCIFEGRIIHEWTSPAGFQVVQAVISSEVHSGEDWYAVSRACTQIKDIRKNLSDWEWGELWKMIRPMFVLEET